MDESENDGSCHLRWMGPQLGDQFPDLRGVTQDTNRFSLHEYLGKSWGIVFMHPADFTPVCTTEIGAAQSLIDEFNVRGVKLCGFSCDDASKHRAWLADIEAATGQRISFPLFCDPTRIHAIELGVFDPNLKDDEGLPLTVRSVFIINPKKTIALTMTYPVCVGRNFDEILRVADALQRAENFDVATPANWQPGDKTIVSYNLDDREATERFGKNGYTTVNMPSEQGRKLDKHYLRYTDDPVLTSRNKQSFKLAVRITRPKMSWRPPKSFALSLFMPGNKKRTQQAADEAAGSTRGSSQLQTTNDLTKDTSIRTGGGIEQAPNHQQQANKKPTVDYSNHKPWKHLLRQFTGNLRPEASTEETTNSVSADTCEDAAGDGLLVGFGKKGKGGDCVISGNDHVGW